MIIRMTKSTTKLSAIDNNNIIIPKQGKAYKTSGHLMENQSRENPVALHGRGRFLDSIGALGPKQSSESCCSAQSLYLQILACQPVSFKASFSRAPKTLNRLIFRISSSQLLALITGLEIKGKRRAVDIRQPNTLITLQQGLTFHRTFLRRKQQF